MPLPAPCLRARTPTHTHLLLGASATLALLPMGINAGGRARTPGERATRATAR